VPDPINVPVPCTCPQAHEDGDVVYLAPVLGLRGGLAVEAAMSDPNPTLAVSLALIQHNVLDWSKTDEKGDPVPITDANLEALLPWAKGGEIVANRAAGLYLEDAFAPLANRLADSSRPSRTNGQTRPLLASRKPSRRKPSGSSSPVASDGGPSATTP
jgi:hypothetical protein